VPELLDWKKNNFNSNRLGDETKFCVQPAGAECNAERISRKFKKQLEKKFAGYGIAQEFLKFPKAQYFYSPTTFVNYVDALDAIRKTNWRVTFSELAKSI
jgi:hypothetical protein